MIVVLGECEAQGCGRTDVPINECDHCHHLLCENHPLIEERDPIYGRVVYRWCVRCRENYDGPSDRSNELRAEA